MAFLEKKALYGPWFVTVNIRDSQNVTTITEASRICHVAIIIARPSRNLVFKANLAFIRHGFQQKLRFLKRILVSILSFVHANNSLWICHGSVTYMSWTIQSRVLKGFTHFDLHGCSTVTSFTNLPVSERVNASATFWSKL